MEVPLFLHSGIGSVTSCRAVAATFGEDICNVRKFMYALVRAYLFHRVERYNICGQRLLRNCEKYYTTDVRMGNAGQAVSPRETLWDLGKHRPSGDEEIGYRVCAGGYGDYEADFVAMRSGSILYFQTTNSTLPEDVHNRELRPLRFIRDGFLKTVLSMDGFRVPLPRGITHRNMVL